MLTYILLFLSCSSILAQNGSLVASWDSEGGVELKWYTSDLVNYEGVNVFRKTGSSQEWVQLNDKLIIADRKVIKSINDEIELVNTVVRNRKSLNGIVKLNVMLSSFKYKESAKTMGIYFQDLTTFNGKHKYEIRSVSGKVIAITEIDCDEIFEVESPLNFRLDQKRKKLKMFWSTDPMQFYAVNVYSLINGIETKMNKYPVMASDQSDYDSTERFQFEMVLEEKTNYEFYIKSVGFFNNESKESKRILISLGDITAPAAPQGLSYSQKGRNTVLLKWNTYDEIGASELVFFRGLNYDSLTEVGVALLSDIEFIDQPDFSGDVYYAIGARDSAGNQSISERIIVHVEDMFPPSSPTGLTAFSDSGRVDLNWIGVNDTDLAGYLLFRSGGSGKNFKLMNADPLKETNYVFKSSMRSKSAVRFFVLAVDSAYNRSGALDTITIEMKDYIAPASPLIKNIEVVNGYINVLWMANTELDLKEYEIYRKLIEGTNDFEQVGTALSGRTSFIDSTCTSLKKYQYLIRAKDDSNNISEKSNIFTVKAPFKNNLADEKFKVKYKYKKKNQSLTLKWKEQNTSGYMLFEMKENKKHRMSGMMKKTKYTIFEVEKGSEWLVMGYANDGAKYSSQIIIIQ